MCMLDVCVFECVHILCSYVCARVRCVRVYVRMHVRMCICSSAYSPCVVLVAIRLCFGALHLNYLCLKC